MTTVLRDPEANRRLLRDGFVVVPFLDRARALELRAQVHAELPHLAAAEGPGFYCDMDTSDQALRRRATEIIDRELGAAASDLFVAHRPFIRNFLQKWPGPDSDVHLHRDWTYVDERAGHRTYTLWIALDDVDADQGQLRVSRSSHTIDRMLRGSNLRASWLDHEEVFERTMLSVPVRAGDAIVFDNALTHSSHPNLSDRPRLAAGLAFHHVDHQLVHYRRVDDLTAARYLVDEEFFQTCDPRALHAAPPELPVDGVEAIESTELTSEELARALRRSPLAKLDHAQRILRQTRETLAAQPERAATAVRTQRERATEALAAIMQGDQAERVRAWKAAAGPRVAAWRSRARTLRDELPSKAAVAVLGANEALIDRFGPDSPAVWDHHLFPWSETVEAAWPQVRAEVEQLLVGRTEIPHIEEVTGGIPQGNEGVWRTFVLMHQGRWIDWNCARCPETTRLVRAIPGLTMAGFSVLEPGTHITEHRGPNKGALRYQLGVMVPGKEGDCRIRVGHDMLHWHEGEGVMFDFTVPHEAWNDTEAIRVLLMLEVITPLPWYLAPTNRLAQRAMGWFPTTRDITNRLRRLEPTLVRDEMPEPAPV